MTTRESDVAGKITTYLDRGAAGLRAGTAYRLQQMRTEVLAHLADVQHERASSGEMAHALAGGAGDRRRSGRGALRRWAGVFLLGAVAWLGWQQWQAFQQIRDFGELDAQILSSDLPIDAYMDRGFQVWLKASYDR
jgi:hypothetical protein